MGNQSSSSVALSHPPPTWTQSFPREKKRSLQNKHSSPENKVLPERIPGQRLRPTENGHILHTQGTISARHLSEFHAPHHSGYPPPPGPMMHPMMQPMPHHHSMTHLQHQMSMHGHHSGSTSALHHQQMYDERAASMHNLRIGYPPKNYASEPDLRGASPPVAPTTPHTIISQSPTKGKIKSKKKSKAPTPPKEIQSSPRASETLDSNYSLSSSLQNQPWPQEIQHPKEEKKTKSRKIGLFRKKHESRKLHNNNEEKAAINEDARARSVSENYRAKSPNGISPREELRERARSLDCLQHELRQSLCRSPPTTASLTHLNHPAMNEQRLWATLDRDSKRRSGQFDQNTHKVNTIERESRRRSNQEFEARRNSTIEREQRSTRRMSTLERKAEEKKLSNVESRDGSIKSSSRLSEHRNTHHDFIKEEPLNAKDPWDEAEEEIEEKKKENALFQAEILRKSKSLKTNIITDEVSKNSSLKREKVVRHSIQVSSQNEIVKNESAAVDNEQPKTFFFGMEPPVHKDKNSETNTGLAKIKAQDERRKEAVSPNKKEDTHIKEEIRISGESVEFSRRTLERKDKSRSIKNSTTQEIPKNEETKKVKPESGRRSSRKLSKDVEDFAVAIERNKLNRTINEDGASGSSRPDGGYHSRQNSGSFHLDTEQEDNENELSMNLRPTLPRRQLEIPRFSPNQAWRSLSLERAEKQQHDPLNESRSSEDPESVFEARIQRYTRPTAPPRGSGEKSADSGISGDAGSPGPTHEFEPLTTPEKSKSSSGPLAVSSPVTSGRAEIGRAWTPAQDLDDNSLDGSGEPTGLPTGLSTPPKLTVRSNMFPKPRDNANDTEYSPDYSPELPEEPIFSDSTTPEKKESYTKRKKRSTLETSQQKTSSLRKIKRHVEADDTWRDNWSMSRSIPTSLNTCEEHDSVSNLSSHRIENRSRSESRVSRGDEVDSRPRTPAYSVPTYNTYGSGGHIMYLPDYKSSKLSCDELTDEEDERRPQLLTTTAPPHPALHDLHHFHNSPGGSQNSSVPNLAQPLHQAVRPLTPDTERKPPSGDECPVNPENYSGPQSLPTTFSSQFQNVYLGRRAKKSKKFSYQSTVRILEKRKLEEKIAREVEEKERLRLSEAEQMRKVEEEFQRKREREKKNLKQQKIVQQNNKQQYKKKLQHQIQHQHQNVQVHSQEEKPSRKPQTYGNDHTTLISRQYKDVHNHSYSSDDHVPSSSSYTSESHEVSSQDSAHPPPLPSSPVPTQVYIGGYNPMPVEAQVKMSSRLHDTSSESNQGLLNGIKSWVKGQKGSQTSSTSLTINSATRQEPDGADASDSPRKPGDDFRAEIIAASRKRNANSDSSNHDSDIISNTSSNVQPNSSYQNNHLKKSVVRESHKSSHSHRSSSQSTNSRTHSPDTKKLTQELPEHIQERREYFEYRSPSRHFRSTHSPSRNSHSSSSKSNKSKSKSKRDNYRAEFCHGNAHAVIPNVVAVKSKHHDDIDRYSKQSSDERVSEHSSSVVRSVSQDHLDKASTSSSYSHKKMSLQHQLEDSYTHNFNRIYNGDPPPTSVDSSPARFAHNLLQPFNSAKGYRPVAFTPPPPTKILHVN